MKKLSAIILTFILLMSMLVPTTMAAEAFSEKNITVTPTAYDIKVTVTTEEDGTMVAYLFEERAVKDKDGNVVTELIEHGLDYYTATTPENGVYTYEFDFTMDAEVPTTTLYIRVGNNVSTTTKPFEYTNIDDKKKFYDGLEKITDDTLVEGYLTNPDNVSKTSEEVQAYIKSYSEDLSSDTQTMIDKAIVNEIVTKLKLITGDLVDVVKKKDALFAEEFAKVLKYAYIVDAAADAEEWETKANAAIGEELFDGKYYKPESETISALLDIEDVRSHFVTEVNFMTGLTETEMEKAFDRATLMAIEGSDSDYDILKTAFMYFEEKETIAVSDMTKIDELAAAGTDTELWKNVKDGSYENCAALIAKAVELSGGDTGTTGGTNNNVTKPSSPGSFTGGSLPGGNGGSSAPTTPEVPKEPVIPEGVFTDIDNVEWAREAIEALAEKGVLSGKGNGIFAPNDSVTREEFVKIIVAAFELADDTAECDFADVEKDGWSYPYIAAANKLGVVTGDGENFNPKAGISRQDMAVIISRVFELLGAEVTGEEIEFTDADAIADYAKDAVALLSGAGIINGMGDGIFAPTGAVTRAQAAKVVYGLLDLIGGGK